MVENTQQTTEYEIKMCLQPGEGQRELTRDIARVRKRKGDKVSKTLHAVHLKTITPAVFGISCRCRDIESHMHKEVCRPPHSVHQIHAPMKGKREEGDKAM